MRPWLLRLAAIALLLGLPPAVKPDSALACSCAEPLSPQEAYQEYELIFSGRVVRVHDIPPEENDGLLDERVSQFKVFTVWKGPSYETVWVESAAGSACGFSFVEGREYLVFVRWLSVSLCSPTRELAAAGEYLIAMGEGFPAEPGTAGPKSRLLDYLEIGPTEAPQSADASSVSGEAPGEPADPQPVPAAAPSGDAALPVWAIGLIAAAAGLLGVGTAFAAISRRRARQT